MPRYVIAAVLVVSAPSMTALGLLQHRRGCPTGASPASVLGGATSTLVVAGALVLP